MQIKKNGRAAETNKINTCYETFGQKKDPALLLIITTCDQDIMWTGEFCESLASEGFYVIRYDHRTASCSTSFDFETNPHLDIIKNSLNIVNELEIYEVYLCGLSMTGSVDEFMTIHGARTNANDCVDCNILGLQTL